MSNLFKINCQIEFHVKTANNFTIVKTVNTFIRVKLSEYVQDLNSIFPKLN